MAGKTGALVTPGFPVTWKEGRGEMKVVVGNNVYTAKDQPIMVILNKRDKRLIAEMAKDAKCFASYPGRLDPVMIEKWMETHCGGKDK
jgi:hypothetical protein